MPAAEPTHQNGAPTNTDEDDDTSHVSSLGTESPADGDAERSFVTPSNDHPDGAAGSTSGSAATITADWGEKLLCQLDDEQTDALLARGKAYVRDILFHEAKFPYPEWFGIDQELGKQICGEGMCINPFEAETTTWWAYQDLGKYFKTIFMTRRNNAVLNIRKQLRAGKCG